MASTPYEPRGAAEYLAHLEHVADTMTATLAAADLAATVPACPGWTLRDLAEHLRYVHLWAAGAVVEGHPNTPEPDPVQDNGIGLAVGYREAADALLAILRTTAPDAPAWTFGAHPRTAAFWLRRQPNEVAVHLVDALASQGLDAVLDPALALDGVDEVVTLFFRRQVRLGRTPPLRRSLALVVDGLPHRWVVTGDGTGPAAEADADAEATLTGPADRLLLLLWKRTGLDDDPTIRLDGDESAARDVLGAAITP